MAILHSVTISVSFFHITKALYGKKKKWKKKEKGKTPHSYQWWLVNLQFMICEKHGEITGSQEGRVTSHDIINSVNVKLYVCMLRMGDLSVELMEKGVDSALV